jgi:hypothetical protein
VTRAAPVLLAVMLASCNGDGAHTPQTTPSPRALNFAGRPTAITPAVALHVTSVKLTTRIPRRVRNTCRAARTFTCPRRVPVGGIFPHRYAYGPEEAGRSLYVLSFNNGTIRGYFHWIVGAGTRAAIARDLIDDRWHEQKGLPKRIRLLSLGSTRIALYRFPQYPAGGYLGGHTVAFADDGGRVVFATVHGYGHADADVALVADMLGTR